jgi:hypothetical protein
MVTFPTTASQVATLDVAYEVEAAIFVEHLRGLLDRLVALALLLADREQRDPRLLDAENSLGIQRAHVGELVQVVAARVHVRADVEEDEGARLGDHLDRQRGPINARQSPELQDRGGHAGARVARGHERVGPALLDQVHGDHDRRILLGLQREGRRFVHPHDLAGRDDLDVRRNGSAGDLGDALRDADEQHPIRRMDARPRERAGDYLERSVVATHRVDSDADRTIPNRPNRAQVHRFRPAAAAFPA